ncbi:MAG: alpha-amylase family glycosyl hydrolase [Isosphaeraceae bacterium]
MPDESSNSAESGVLVQFFYLPGLKREVFSNVRLRGSWDGSGRYSDDWSTLSMVGFIGPDGCPGYRASARFDPAQVGWTFRWGVILDGPSGKDQWGIATEVNDPHSDERTRSFVLSTPTPGAVAREIYYLTHVRRLGAQKNTREGTNGEGIRFSAWAPNARAVEVVFGTLFHADDRGHAPRDTPMPRGSIAGGYVADDGTGIHPGRGPLAMTKGPDGVWVTDENDPRLANFTDFDHKPYMFRVTRDDGSVVLKTDIYSRCQVGGGRQDPRGGQYFGLVSDLDGTVSCSVVVDADKVTGYFEDPRGEWPESDWLDSEEFWADENDRVGGAHSPPHRVDDLILYELHVGALGGPNKQGPGTLKDARALVGDLADLGINAVELLPMSQFSGEENWGYGTSHYFAIEYSGGGRDQYKYFIKDCHRHGIAVIFDVVYNHYTPNAGRAQWLYDTADVTKNPYDWYEGRPSDYPAFQHAVAPADRDLGGYVDNMSTGFSPRFHDETVRKMFISSAAMLMEEFHVDGFRVDQTTSMHSYNVLHADGRPLPVVNQFGAKFLRELTRTLRLINPRVILTAEDHSGWDKVTQPPDSGGLGFDKAWYADFYHHLMGDTEKGSDYAKLIKTAGLGDDRALAMGYFAGALGASGGDRIVYNESHDEAGNSRGTKRSIVVAVNGAPLLDSTRRFAEARCRMAFAATALSAGTPMFLFGEEVGFEKDFLYDRIFANREDLIGYRNGQGRHLFALYRDLILLRRARAGLRSRNIDVIHVHDGNRVLAWRRWGAGEEFLVLSSLNNRPFDAGYTVASGSIPGGTWREIFNTDAHRYGGDNVGNYGADIPTPGGSIHAVIPANGAIVLQRVAPN